MVECLKDTASRFNLDRPGIERVRQGFADVVLTHAVNRLSRNQTHIAVLLDAIERVGATLEFVTEDFENIPVGRLMLNVGAFAGEVEREKIAERPMPGQATGDANADLAVVLFDQIMAPANYSASPDSIRSYRGVGTTNLRRRPSSLLIVGSATEPSRPTCQGRVLEIDDQAPVLEVDQRQPTAT